MRVIDALRVLRSAAEDCEFDDGDDFDRDGHVCELGASCPYGPDDTYLDDPEDDDPDEG